MTKHADVEVSGQTVETCLIKHRSNNWYKPLSKAVQTNKTSPTKHDNKRNVLSFWLKVWWPANFVEHDQTQSNTIKQHQTRCPRSPNNVWWCVVTKHFSFAQAFTILTRSRFASFCCRLSLKQGTGKRGTGNGERGTGNGERGTGNGERRTGNGERGTGNL